MERNVLLALGAAREAWADAGLDSHYPSERVGVLLGSAIGGLIGIAEQTEVLRARGHDRVSPFFIPSVLVDSASGQIAISLGLRGPNYAPVSAARPARTPSARRGDDQARRWPTSSSRAAPRHASTRSSSPASAPCAASPTTTTTRRALRARSTRRAPAS